jgi:peptidoglycan endopeptidase LytF
MQRMKQLALGAFSITLATAGVAYAGGDREHGPATDKGGRSSQPAPHTGSAAPSDPATDRSSSMGQGASTMASSGMNRSQIEQMQNELASRGLYSGEIDGMAGPQTMAALRQFQQQQGLPVSGSFDDATRRALGVQLDRQTVSGAQTSAGPELERPVGREGATTSVSGAKPMRSQVQLERLNPAQLRTLQTRLSELGFYQGSVDGVLGEATRAGLRQFFQTQADLASRGIITDATVSLFGVSPQGLNPPTGSPASSSPASSSPATGTNPSWGTQPRGSEARDGANQPSGVSTPRQGTTPMPQPTNPSQGTH